VTTSNLIYRLFLFTNIEERGPLDAEMNVRTSEENGELTPWICSLKRSSQGTLPVLFLTNELLRLAELKWGGKPCRGL
jgi:hypothetical protein